MRHGDLLTTIFKTKQKPPKSPRETEFCRRDICETEPTPEWWPMSAPHGDSSWKYIWGQYEGSRLKYTSVGAIHDSQRS